MWGPETLPPLVGPPDTNIPTDPRPTNAPLTIASVPDTGLDASVPWNRYDRALRGHVAGLAMAGDCDGLRDEFATFYGADHTELLVYLDRLLHEIDCV